MSPEEIQQLFDYNAWANRRALEASEKVSVEQFLQRIDSSFPSLRDTLAHIYGAEWIWLERFQGRSPSALPASAEFTDINSLRQQWIEHEARLLKFVGGLSQADLDRELEYKTLKFGVYQNPLWQSLLHVINHGTHHRSQVTTMLRQLGAQPILTDLMHFYRERSLAKSA
jgi:uncharacterized damage-inducible protein DinB